MKTNLVPYIRHFPGQQNWRNSRESILLTFHRKLHEQGTSNVFGKWYTSNLVYVHSIFDWLTIKETTAHELE